MKNIFELPPQAKAEGENKDKQEIAHYGERFEQDLARKRDEMRKEAREAFAEKLITPVHNFVVEVKGNEEDERRFKRFTKEAGNLNV